MNTSSTNNMSDHQHDSTNTNPILQSYRYGFVKAFTDAPDTLMSGFARVDKILKSLFVRRLYIYPRFHTVVAEELERNPPIVEEMHQSLSPKMIHKQAAIAAAVQTCIREIKKSTSLINWSLNDGSGNGNGDKDGAGSGGRDGLTLENCVTTAFI